MELMMPILHDAPEPDFGQASRTYCYRNSLSEALFYVLRFEDTEGNKFFRPYTCWERDDGSLQWRPKAPPEPRPLYGLEQLAKKPDALVLVVEGEKACEAARELLPAYACVTTMNGAQSPSKSDFRPLEGRSVIIWRDADDPGLKYEQTCIKLAYAAGALECRAVNLPDDLPEGWDLADPLPFGYGRQWLDEALANAIPQSPPRALPEVELICMDDVEMKPIDWLWPDRIALGKPTILAGNPGLGKSQLTAFFAAMVTTGGDWPNDEGQAPLGSVVILSAEDDAADTIKPRLLTAGADVSRCYILDAVNIERDGKNSIRSFNLTEDASKLEAVLKQLGDVKLVVIDPITAYLGRVDSHNNADIRAVLTPFSQLAAQYGVALLGVTHFNKSMTQDAIGRFIGSIGMVAAARAAYAVIKDTADPTLRHFVPVKNNNGNDYDGFSYTIKSAQLTAFVQSSKIVWKDGLVTAKSILEPSEDSKPTATNDAGFFLEGLLVGGPMLASEIYDLAEGAGYSKSSIQRAKHRLGIKQRKLGMKEGWEWFWPGEDVEENRPKG